LVTLPLGGIRYAAERCGERTERLGPDLVRSAVGEQNFTGNSKEEIWIRLREERQAGGCEVTRNLYPIPRQVLRISDQPVERIPRKLATRHIEQ
jgi:hypothetical protein